MQAHRIGRPPHAKRIRTVIRPRDVASRGLTRTAITRLVEAGALERVGRGLYAPVGAKVTEHRPLVEAMKRVPKGVVSP